MSRAYSKRNRRSRRTRQAEMAIMQAIAAQELAAVLDNVTTALDQPGLDEVTSQAFVTPNDTQREVGR